MSSLSSAPTYSLHRTVKDAADGAGAITDVRRGVNAQGFEHLNIQVVPDGGANPVVEVLFWSQEAGKFVSADTALTFGPNGADVSFEAHVDIRGRIFFVKLVSGIAATDVVKILVSGSELDHLR